VERDPYDLFLERVAREVNLQKEYGKEGAREAMEDVCQSCLCKVPKGSRHCPTCGALMALPEGISTTFKQKTVIKRHLAITLLAIEYGVEIENRKFTKVHLKIQNFSSRRVHISLTYVDSVLIDLTGRQYSPVDADEFTEDPGENVFPTWFYIYPDAFREGVLLFKESAVPLQKAIVCAMHQENEDELFVFDLDMPPSIKD
jgi:hypothetical protein